MPDNKAVKSEVAQLEAKFAGATEEALAEVNGALDSVRETNRANAIVTAYNDFLDARSGRYCKAVGEQVGSKQHFIWNPWDAKPTHVGVRLSYIIVVDMTSDLTKVRKTPDINAKGHAEIFEVAECVGSPAGIRKADVVNIFPGSYKDGNIVPANELDN